MMRRLFVIAVLFVLIAWSPDGRDVEIETDCLHRQSVKFTNALIDVFGVDTVAEWMSKGKSILLSGKTDANGRFICIDRWRSNIEDFDDYFLPRISEYLTSNKAPEWSVCVLPDSYTVRQELEIKEQDKNNVYAHVMFSRGSVNIAEQGTIKDSIITVLRHVHDTPDQRFVGYVSYIPGRTTCIEHTIILPDSVSKHCNYHEGRICITCDGYFRGDSFEIKRTTVCNLWDDSLLVEGKQPSELMDFFDAYIHRNVGFENYHNPSVNYDSLVRLDLRIDAEFEIKK